MSTGCCPKLLATPLRVMLTFLKCLVGSLSTKEKAEPCLALIKLPNLKQPYYVKLPALKGGASQEMVIMPFLKCLVGGLRHFRTLRNGGDPLAPRSAGTGRTGRGEACPPSRAAQARRAGITRP